MKDVHWNGYTITCKPWRFNVKNVMPLLGLTYWAKSRPKAVVARSLRHSTPFGVFDPAGKLVGFMRITSDTSTVYYLADVVLAEETRGKGLGLMMVKYALSNTRVCRGKGLLLTQTAAGLYEKVGFYKVGDRLMIRDPVTM